MTAEKLTRRSFMGGALASTLLGRARPESRMEAFRGEGTYRLFWGDLHNHNAVGYAKGSLKRSIDLALEHLDFFAFTGHASWHDMPKMPGDRHMKWVKGFQVHSGHWPKTRQLIREANSKGFVALLGYEWHSSRFGDYCLIFPEDQPELFLPDHVNKLLDFAETKGALAIPHHVGYKQGWRGANWAYFRANVSPIVEIFSEHGCTESDRAPLPMIRHSNGGRSASNSIQPQLARGLRFGFVASSDDHLGYPGAYGEGLLGVWAEDLRRDSLFEAFRSRRTYAATGDRIILDVKLNGWPMGSQLAEQADRQVDVRVEGQDAIAMIELVRNGRVIERYFPEDQMKGPLKLPGRAKCRIQYGWGPWAALNLGRICHWDFTVRLEGGRFHQALGCFQSTPSEEDLRDRLRIVSDREIHLESHTTRVGCFAEDPTKSLICELEGAPDAVLSVHLRKPVEQVVKARLADLIDDNVVNFTGVFTSESYIIHRLVAPTEYSATIRWHDRRTGEGPDYYYVRVTQSNGHLAWSSPIWVG
ncbi:DUF3604 domain-containing protein [Acidobacteria bacterium AH-259-O06]|nr:DUF3604 domain-containing protein [Acidobacteria bacterium AH-259-O06]